MRTRAGLVDQVDRLVREMAVLDVAVGEHRRRAERVVGDLHAMVRLVAVAQAAQDLHGLVDRRLLDAHLLESPLEGGVALAYLRYSSSVVAPIVWSSPRAAPA